MLDKGSTVRNGVQSVGDREGGWLSEQLKRKDCGVQSKLTLPWLSLGVELVLF